MTKDEFKKLLSEIIEKQLIPYFLGAYQQGQLNMKNRAIAACKAETSRRAIAVLTIEESPLQEKKT